MIGDAETPDGVAHVPSPRQKVDELADVPLFKFVTGRLPPTPPFPEAARLPCATLAAASVPDPMLVALVASVEHEAAAFERSAQAACETTPEPSPLSAPVIVPAPPRACARVPELMLLAFVVSVRADAAGAPPSFSSAPDAPLKNAKIRHDSANTHRRWGSVANQAA